MNKNYIKQFIILFSCVFFLFLITYKDYYVKENNRINNVSGIMQVNENRISADSLFKNAWLTIKNNYYLNDLNKQNWSRWKNRYKNKIKDDDDAYVAINSMIASLDDSYSKFMSENEFLEQNRAIASKLFGIGINISSISGKIYIVNVLKDAPAYNQGVKTGDIILKINNQNVNGESIYQTAQLIRGNLNEYVELELLRGEEKFVKNIKREEIKVKTIDYKKISDDIGYIRISSFIGADTSQEFIAVLNKLSSTKGLIIDLRGNSGGLFQNAIIISNLFMKKGTIVSVIARQGKKNTYNAKSNGCIYDNPVVILIDKESASASEILSSALHDNNRAVLVGTKTYGKGLVQKVFSMPNKSGLNLTIARYLTPLGNDINKVGIKPDYTVTLAHSDLVNDVDSQLDFAKNYLEKQIK